MISTKKPFRPAQREAQPEPCDCVRCQAIADAARPEPDGGGEVKTLRTLLDNLVIAQKLSREIREHATDEARSYLYNTRTTAQTPTPEGQTEGVVEIAEAALRKIAGLNDLEGVPDDEVESAACHALHECELTAREALAALSTSKEPG